MNPAVPPAPEPPSVAEFADSFGAVALAAYEPDEPMFARQLLSIQSQTHTNFVCLISADGNFERVQDMVGRICGGDDRFLVLGYSSRLGFHHNFERALSEVPAEARWVALSDQDDYWYPEKLTTLLPYLEDAALVTGQARVVSPEVSARGVDPSVGTITRRRNVPAADLLANNQVTGSLCIFRRELLKLALPFPSLGTPSQYHDHWIALCAMADKGISIQQFVLQDYVQHSANVVGESTQKLSKSVRNTWRIVRRYEPDSSPASIARLIYKTGLGWRTLMANTLLERFQEPRLPAPQELQEALSIYARPRATQLFRSLLNGVVRKNISPIRALEIYLGVILRPRRHNRPGLPG